MLKMSGIFELISRRNRYDKGLSKIIIFEILWHYQLWQLLDGPTWVSPL